MDDVKKIIGWVRNHKALTILMIIFTFLLPLVIIHILFKIKVPESCITSAEWSAGDVIQYCVGFFTLLGTLALGAVAVIQSERANEIAYSAERASEYANEINARMVEYETLDKLRSSMPTIFLDHVEHDISNSKNLIKTLEGNYLYFDKPISGECYHMCFLITNSTNDTINFSQPYLIVSHGEQRKIFNTSEFGYSENTMLQPNESKQIHFMTSAENANCLHGYKLSLKVNLYNRFGEAYRQNINGLIVANRVSEKYMVLFNTYSDFERYNYTTNKWVSLDFYNALSFRQS